MIDLEKLREQAPYVGLIDYELIELLDHIAQLEKDAERYRWLVGARTKEQADCVSGTVCNPLPQDHVLSEMQCFFLCKEQADSLIDAAMEAKHG